jgi:sugar phosphate isomerase/epimerase
MHLKHGMHLAYCTNVHAAETWAAVRRVLQEEVLAVKAKVAPGAEPFGVGLWLAAEAAQELAEPAARAELSALLAQKGLYVFTLNGFPYGKFHGERVKEQVYRPDWTEPARREHTVRLFDLLAALLPKDVATGSVSTLPGSFKGFGLDSSAQEEMFRQLAQCAAEIDRLRDRHGRDLVLGLEPEPLGWLETTAETVDFFWKFFLRKDTPRCAREIIGVTYDACHLAVEYEDAGQSLGMLRDAGIRLAKVHFSSALRVEPTDAGLAALRRFDEPVYLHQVVARAADGALRRFEDLPEALAWAEEVSVAARGQEWRVHFHVPLQATPEPPLGDTREHLAAVMDFLAREPEACTHLEMETYTWAVLPEPLRAVRVEEQVAAEYAWTLRELKRRGLAEDT